MSEKYDMVFSLGSMPIVSEVLQNTELQIFNFPFDKVLGGDYFERMNLILTNFNEYFMKANLVLEQNPKLSNGVQIKDTKFGFVYTSDINPNLSIHENYPILKDKIERYKKNFNICLSRAKKVLIVYVENPTIAEDDDATSSFLIQSIEHLKKKYSDKEFRILYIKNAPNKSTMDITPVGHCSEKMTYTFYHRISETSSYFFDVESLKIALMGFSLNTSLRQKKILFLRKIMNFVSKFI